jgi:cytochrome bd-type quinol oxidase subunit 2
LGTCDLAPFRIAQRAIENTKENIKEEAREAASDILKILIISLCTLFFLIFGSITIASAINTSSNSAWVGYASVTGFYLILAVGVYVWKQTRKERKQREMYDHNNELRV